MLVTQGQSLQLRADGQVEADVVITTDSLLTLHLIQRRDSVLASFIIEKFCERGIEVGTIFEFPDSNCSQNKIAASCSYIIKKLELFACLLFLFIIAFLSLCRGEVERVLR
jgi:hypothetical protein